MSFLTTWVAQGAEVVVGLLVSDSGIEGDAAEAAVFVLLTDVAILPVLVSDSLQAAAPVDLSVVTAAGLNRIWQSLRN